MHLALMFIFTGVSLAQPPVIRERGAIDPSVNKSQEYTPEQQEKAAKVMSLPKANLGFNVVEQSKLPFAPKLLKSVFRIRSAAGMSIRFAEVTKNLQIENKYEVFLRRTMGLLAEAPETEKGAVLQIIGQVKSCQSLELQEDDCIIFMGESSGTAFITGDGSVLWTAAHNLKTLIKAGMKPGFRLYDYNDQLVFDGLQENFTVEIINENYTKKEETDPSLKCSKHVNDWLKIKLPRSLGAGLQISVAIPNLNEKVFQVGYPWQTNDRKRLDPNISDSNGKSLYFSEGQVRGNELEFIMESCPKELGDSYQGIIVTHADGKQGMSGGPVLNELGEVIGIFNYSFPPSASAVNFLRTLSTSFSVILNQTRPKYR